MLIDRRNAVQNQTFAHWLLPCPRWNLGSSRRPPRATRTVMPPTPTAEEDEYNPAAILLTSGLLHSFIQGMIISQVGRYYEDYYHLDTLLMKLYVGSIVVVSLCVFHRRVTQILTAWNSSAQTTYISYKTWAVIIFHGEQNDAVCSRFPNFTFHATLTSLQGIIKALTAADLLLNGVLCALCHTYLIKRCWKVSDPL